MTTMQEARGKPVYTSDGERIGDVDLIMEDVETRKPEWFVIGTATLGRKRVVPVAGSEVRSDGVFVRYSAAQVRATPEIEGEQISQETERRLYSQYGLQYSEKRSSTGLPERESARKSTRTVQSTSDEPTKAELYEEAKKLDISGRSKMNKQQLLRAVERARGSADKSGRSRAKANPIHVQEFLEGVGYPTRTGDLVREAERQGASEEVRMTLERLPEKRFEAPTDVSEAIGRLA